MACCPTLPGLAVLARPLHPSLPARHNASPVLLIRAGKLTENFAWKRLDSRSVDQPKMCHAQIKESCAYYESKTQPECRHRGSRSSRRGDPHPHLSSHSRPNQLFPWAATCLRRSSGTGKAEQRKPPRLSSSRDRLRERLRSTTPVAMKEL